MEYKNTLLMPKTNFEMRGNLKDKGFVFINEWNSKKLYDKLEERKGKQFILHDGPPYANGNIHIGHALNKILKDFVIRNNSLAGKKIHWRTGWDTHGLPIELKVQQLGIKLTEVGKEKYLKSCYDYAKDQVSKQQEQFSQLGLLTNFNKKYLTLDSDFESNQIEVFNEMLNRKLIYQDLKPVYWSWSSQTALAEAEIEYKDSVDFSTYIKFKHEKSDVNFLIWTTTPWTIPANVGIAFGEKINYSLVEIEKEKLIVASNLIEDIEKTVGKSVKLITSNIDVKKYIGEYAINPLNNNKSKLLFGHHVTTESGTGVVHIAGGHGHDDYLIVKEHKLDLVVVMDDKGHMINSGDLDGEFYLKANKTIIEKLKLNNTLLFANKFTHSVPIDWRTKEPVVYRATKQWFVSIEPIKKDLVKEIKKVNWYPSWGGERLIKMSENRLDWCISRQRIWGVPIPIIYDENKNPIMNKSLQKNIVNAFKKDGIMAWHKLSIEELLPKSIPYHKDMTKEMDILDVWFDSGSSHKTLNGKIADVYLEGNDQYRGWFNSSLITSVITNNKAPYKNVLTHGFVNDAKGNKMSKSLGNVIDPLEIVNKYGADILRLWVASSNYQDNLKISDEAIKQVSNDYRKIRNTIRFILGTLNDYDGSKPKLNPLVKSTLNNIKESFDKNIKRYSEFNFIKIIKDIMNELNNGPISYLLDYSKDILYVLEEDNPSRRGVQYALNEILKYILYLLGPVIPVTVEEAWKEIDSSKLFFETTYPKFNTYSSKPIDEIVKIREVVNKEIEILREQKTIRTSQEVSVELSLPKEFDSWKDSLKEFLMVGELKVSNGDLSAKVKKFDGTKCERCWKFFDKENMDGPICKTCKSVLDKIK